MLKVTTTERQEVAAYPKAGGKREEGVVLRTQKVGVGRAPGAETSEEGVPLVLASEGLQSGWSGTVRRKVETGINARVKCIGGSVCVGTMTNRKEHIPLLLFQPCSLLLAHAVCARGKM